MYTVEVVEETSVVEDGTLVVTPLFEEVVDPDDVEVVLLGPEGVIDDETLDEVKETVLEVVSDEKELVELVLVEFWKGGRVE